MRLTQKLATCFACAGILCLSGMTDGLAAPEKKLHLMYLVTAKAGDLKPGSVVAVEPAFFTDGEKIVFAYDFCERERPTEETVVPRRSLRHKQKHFAGDIAPIEEWCYQLALHDRFLDDAKAIPIKIGIDRLVGLDHEGVQITLASLELDGTKQASRGVIANVSSHKSMVPAQYRQYRFFLMGTNPKLMRRMVPVSWPSAEQAYSLIKKLQEISTDLKSATFLDCSHGQVSLSCGSPMSDAFHAVATQTVAAAFVDVDGDGQVELIGGLRAITNDRTGDRLVWQGTAIVGTDEPRAMGGQRYVYGRSPYEIFHDILFSLPRIVLRTDTCTYLVSSSVAIVPLSGVTERCPFRLSQERVLEPYED